MAHSQRAPLCLLFFSALQAVHAQSSDNASIPIPDVFGANNAAASSATSGWSNETFNDNPTDPLENAAPLWFLPSGTCFPSAATVDDGEQNPGNDPDRCNIQKLDNNCPEQIPWQGPYTLAHEFPTYYLIRYCGDLDQWRILYDVYFTKDTGHKHDWEWAAMIFSKGDDGNYHNAGIISENEGQKNYSPWDEIPEAYTNNARDEEGAEQGATGTHAKMYISKWHHSIHTSPHTDTFKDTCPDNIDQQHGNVDFRNNDYYWEAKQWLEPYYNLQGDFNWGHADSGPYNFLQGNKYDLCSSLTT